MNCEQCNKSESTYLTNKQWLCWACFHKIKVGNISYTIYSTHGSSSSSSPHTKIKSCIDLARSFDADCYLMGHLHSLSTHTGIFQEVKGNQIKERKRVYVLTGHFLDYKGSYAEMKGLQPDKQGSPRIRLNGVVKDIHISL